MILASFIQGPLLWISFLIFLVVIALRLVIFSYSIIKTSGNKKPKWKYNLSTFGRSFVPFHSAAKKKPLYAALRYLFHAFLLAVPILLFGHVFLWSQSRFGWNWFSIPDLWADWMTLALLFLATWFFLRRISIKDVRRNSSGADLAFIAVTALPFLTGYMLSHDSLDFIPALSDNMLLIHMLSGEAMLIMAAFQFLRTRLDGSKCIGCAACGLACPTGTLESIDKDGVRIFEYSHYQCICCGSCVGVCPEDAAWLRHEVSVSRFFQMFSKKLIRSVELQACERCGDRFAPEPQTAKVGSAIDAEYLAFCPKCRQRKHAEVFFNLSPWLSKSRRIARIADSGRPFSA